MSEKSSLNIMDEHLNDSKRLGWLFSLIGGVLGIVGNMWVFITTYADMMAAEAANEGGCDLIVQYFLPAYTDIAILGGVFYMIGFYGFIRKRKWSYSMAVIGNIMALQGSFWPMVPALDGGITPLYMILFLPNVVLFFLLNRYTGKRKRSRVTLALIVGIGMVLACMNGVAGTNRMLFIGWPIFTATQRLTVVSALAWGFVCHAILVKPQKWTIDVAFGAGILQIGVGFPMAIASSISFDKISMFLAAPVVSLVLLVIVIIPGLWDRIVSPPAKE